MLTGGRRPPPHPGNGVEDAAGLLRSQSYLPRGWSAGSPSQPPAHHGLLSPPAHVQSAWFLAPFAASPSWDYSPLRGFKSLRVVLCVHSVRSLHGENKPTAGGEARGRLHGPLQTAPRLGPTVHGTPGDAAWYPPTGLHNRTEAPGTACALTVRQKGKEGHQETPFLPTLPSSYVFSGNFCSLQAPANGFTAPSSKVGITHRQSSQRTPCRALQSTRAPGSPSGSSGGRGEQGREESGVRWQALLEKELRCRPIPSPSKLSQGMTLIR